MFKLEKKNYLFLGAIIGILSFVLLFIGVKFVLGNEVNFNNMIAYLIFSLLAGGLASLLVFFRLKIAFLIYNIGLLIGYFEMYRAFLNGMGGWGDLVGVLSLFIWAAIGLGIGLVIQLGLYLYKRFKK